MKALTNAQAALMARVDAAAPAWYRAANHGERVTLAWLWRHAGRLDRQAWRGVEGQPDAAHEYRRRR